jgi:hypothetical protein
MLRLIAILALAGGLAGCASSPFSQAPASQVAPISNDYIIPSIPRSQYECVTDEGYGRYLPCGYASG